MSAHVLSLGDRVRAHFVAGDPAEGVVRGLEVPLPLLGRGVDVAVPAAGPSDATVVLPFAYSALEKL